MGTGEDAPHGLLVGVFGRHVGHQEVLGDLPGPRLLPADRRRQRGVRPGAALPAGVHRPDEEGQYPEEFGGLRPQAWHQDLLDKAEAGGDMGDMGEGASGGDVAKEGGAIEEEEETAKKGESTAPVGGHNLVELDGYTMRWRPVLKANDDGRTAELTYHPIGGYDADWVAEDEVKSALEDEGEGEAEDLDLVWEDKRATQPPQEAEGQGAESGQASAPSSEL